MVLELCCKLAGASQPDNIGHGFGARAPALLLSAADDEWRKFHARTDVQRANTFRRMKLVSRHGEEIDRPLAQIDWNLANRLHTVNVEHGIRVFTNDAADLFNGK